MENGNTKNLSQLDSHSKDETKNKTTKILRWSHGIAKVRFDPWASGQIHKIARAHAPGMSGTFSPQPRVSDPDMHHGTCVAHVP